MRAFPSNLSVAYTASQEGNGGTSHYHIKRGGKTLMSSVNAVATPEDEAYATLFSAAPQLLAALEEVSEWMRRHTGPADGTEAMLRRAVDLISYVGGTIR
jgi:hypothetical protein